MAAASVEVATFGRHGVVTVPMPKTGRVDDVLQLVFKQLSLKPSSYECFSLYAGELGKPTFQLEPSDKVSVDTKNLCLQRCGFDCSKERKVVKTDDVAVHLLFSEALTEYKKVVSSLHPTPEQRDQLEDYLDPDFLSERQFLETIQNVEGYNSVQFNGYVAKAPIEHNTMIFQVNCEVTCICTEECLEIKSQGGIETKWKWQAIRRWRLEAPDTAMFEVTNIKGNARILENIHINTPGAAYMLQTARSICKELVYRNDPSQRPLQGPTTPIVGKPTDNLYTFVNSLLFGGGPNFTSVTN